MLRENWGYEEWAENYAQALWLEQWRLKNLSEMLVRVFGPETRLELPEERASTSRVITF